MITMELLGKIRRMHVRDRCRNERSPNAPDCHATPCTNGWKPRRKFRLQGLPVRFVKPATSIKSYRGNVVRVGIASGFRSVG